MTSGENFSLGRYILPVRGVVHVSTGNGQFLEGNWEAGRKLEVRCKK